MRSALWDHEYNTDTWSHVRATSWPKLYDAIAGLSRRGRLLDLGCGWGLTGTEIPMENCREYLGVDISAVAVASARKRSAELGFVRNRFEVGAIESFEPDGLFGCILFRESAYYLTDLLSTLEHYRRYLDESGVFIVTLYDRVKFGNIIQTISDNFDVLQSIDGEENGIAVLFRPRQ